MEPPPPPRCPNARCSFGTLVQAVVGAIGWLGLLGLMLQTRTTTDTLRAFLGLVVVTSFLVLVPFAVSTVVDTWRR